MREIFRFRHAPVDTLNEYGGRSVDVDSYARRYPVYAERIRGLIHATQAIVMLGRSTSISVSKTPAPVPEESVSGILGDFRLIREIGRGGMGVVFEAEQMSLGRRVALKVLPFASVLQPTQLQRFQNEIQIAATLERPNIARVPAVGCDRGVQHFAMQLID